MKTSKALVIYGFVHLAVFAALITLAGCNKRDIPATAAVPPVKAWLSAGGKSMLPNFPERALVEVEFGVAYESLQVGDSVIFWDYTRGASALTHHRLVANQGGNWIARGDNNAVPDQSWVTRDNFIARTTGKFALTLTSK